MKSEAVETDRIKTESRQPIHRRKMSKNSSIVNGADESLSYAAEDESVVRQINLAAAFHDHISCTKSADLCKIDGTREARVSLPCETDHIYANCSEVRTRSYSAPNSPSNSKELSAENKRLRSILYVQMELIKRLEEEMSRKDRRIFIYKQESEALKAHLERRERMCLLRKRSHKSDEESTDNNISETKNTQPESSNDDTSTSATPAVVTSENSTTIPSVNLVTRYFGRRSKTIPSRALKRRYLGPPKTTTPSKKPVPKSLSSATSVSSSEHHEDEVTSKPEIPKETKPVREKIPLVEVRKISRKRGKKAKGISRKMDCLMADRDYYLPDNQPPTNSITCTETLIDVPSWKLKPVTSFYQMEGTENINDPVFQRRHLKCEQDERRRKRWDIQRLREQKASEKLKYKYCRDTEKESDNVQKSQSFYPDPCQIQYIEVTDEVPVLAFGHLIPLFQPSEFTLPWKFGERQTESVNNCITTATKKNRTATMGPKIT